MKKIIAFVILAVVSTMVLTGCATRISRPGLEVTTNDPEVARQAANPNTPYTAVDGAIADNLKNRGITTGIQPGSASDYIVPKDNFKSCVAVNSSSYDILIVFTIARLPGGIDAQQIVSRTGTPIPGYESFSIRLSRKGREGYTLKEFTAQPGVWNVTIFHLTQNGKKLIKNDTFPVDVTPGRNMLGANSYDFAYYF